MGKRKNGFKYRTIGQFFLNQNPLRPVSRACRYCDQEIFFVGKYPDSRIFDRETNQPHVCRELIKSKDLAIASYSEDQAPVDFGYRRLTPKSRDQLLNDPFTRQLLEREKNKANK